MKQPHLPSPSLYRGKRIEQEFDKHFVKIQQNRDHPEEEENDRSIKGEKIDLTK